jgi:hypothetical protein
MSCEAVWMVTLSPIQRYIIEPAATWLAAIGVAETSPTSFPAESLEPGFCWFSGVGSGIMGEEARFESPLNCLAT